MQEEKVLEIPPPKTFAIYRKRQMPATQAPKRPLHFTLKTLFLDEIHPAEPQTDGEQQEDEHHASASTMAYPAGMTASTSVRKMKKGGKEDDFAGNPPGTPPSQGGKRKPFRKGIVWCSL